MIPLLLALQAPLPTVGDTIWLERRVTVPGGAEVRPAPWELDGALGLLGRPRTRREGGELVIAYPVVAWVAGTHQVAIPGPIVVRADGASDTLPAEPRTLEVTSVLPAGAVPERTPPQPEAGIVEERITSPLPLLACLLTAALLFVPLAWGWLRRGPPMPAAGPPAAPPLPPVEEWHAAGEHRAVAAVAARELRRALTTHLPGSVPGLVTSRLLRVVSEQRPRWPAEEIGTVLRALEAAEFAERPGADVATLAARAAELARGLEGAA